MDVALLSGLTPFVEECAAAARSIREDPLKSRLERIANAAREVGLSWSGSALGYHANVFYRGLRKPPPGASFSIEWGLDDRDSRFRDGTVGDWEEFDQQDVYGEILRRAAEADPKDELRAINERCKRAFRDLRQEALSTIDALVVERPDSTLSEVRGAISTLKEYDLDAANRNLGAIRVGVISRDMRAIGTGGRIMPAHLSLLAQIDLATSHCDTCDELVQSVRRMESYLKKRALMSAEANASKARDPKSVFIIYGRNARACGEIEKFLLSVGLRPLTFAEARRRAGAHPSVLNIVKLGVASAQAVIALFTPDEWAALDPALRLPADRDHEKFRWQSRPNVLFEAGLAIGLNPGGTILATFGHVELPSDIAGIHYSRLSNEPSRRHEFLLLLKQLGCLVDEGSAFFLDPTKSGDFGSPTSPDVKDPFAS